MEKHHSNYSDFLIRNHGDQKEAAQQLLKITGLSTQNPVSSKKYPQG